jgi:hypothetical protein
MNFWNKNIHKSLKSEAKKTWEKNQNNNILKASLSHCFLFVFSIPQTVCFLLLCFVTKMENKTKKNANRKKNIQKASQNSHHSLIYIICKIYKTEFK